MDCERISSQRQFTSAGAGAGPSKTRMMLKEQRLFTNMQYHRECGIWIFASQILINFQQVPSGEPGPLKPLASSFGDGGHAVFRWRKIPLPS